MNKALLALGTVNSRRRRWRRRRRRRIFDILEQCVGQAARRPDGSMQNVTRPNADGVDVLRSGDDCEQRRQRHRHRRRRRRRHCQRVGAQHFSCS